MYAAMLARANEPPAIEILDDSSGGGGGGGGGDSRADSVIELSGDTEGEGTPFAAPPPRKRHRAAAEARRGTGATHDDEDDEVVSVPVSRRGHGDGGGGDGGSLRVTSRTPWTLARGGAAAGARAATGAASSSSSYGSGATPRTLRIMSWNVAWGVSPRTGPNIDKLADTLQLVRRHKLGNHMPDIIAIQELHLEYEGYLERSRDATPPGYKFFTHGIKDSNGNMVYNTGVGMYVAKDINPRLLERFAFDTELRIVAVEIDFRGERRVVLSAHIPAPTNRGEHRSIRKVIDDNIGQALRGLGDRLLAYVGDLNVTYSTLDARWGKIIYPESADLFKSFLAGPPRLVDTFREMHPGAKKFSSYQNSGRKKRQHIPPDGRVDYVIIREDDSHLLQAADVCDDETLFTVRRDTQLSNNKGGWQALRSDHVPIIAVLGDP